MPCDQVRTMTVDLLLADRELLNSALDTMGARDARYGKTITVNGNTFTVTDGEIQSDGYATEAETQEAARQVRVAYAQATVKKVARKYGWALGKSTTAADGTITIKATK